MQGMPRHTERAFVRILVGTALGAAILVAVSAPVPALPAIALGQICLYRLEIALLVFYGCLLLITPTFSGLTSGRLPVEISTRGARFAEGADRSAELDEAAIRNLEEAITELGQSLADNQTRTEYLAEIVERDSRQRGVDSDHD